MRHYNVIIAGAGPAGTAAAYETARAGLASLVVEIRPQESVPFKSIFTLQDVIAEFGLASSVDNHIGSLRKVRAAALNGNLLPAPGSFEYHLENPANFAVVIDHGLALQLLRERASKAGAQFMFRASPEVEITRNGFLVRLGNSGAVFSSTYFIDATGGKSAIVRKLNCLTDDPWVIACYGVAAQGEFSASTEITVSSPQLGDASWVSPRSHELADVVAAHFVRLSQLDAQSMRDKLETLLRNFESLGFGKIYGLQGGAHGGYIRASPVEAKLPSNLFVAGDSAGQAFPRTGDAFRPALLNGQLLGRLLADGRQDEYEERWRGRFDYGLGLYLLEAKALNGHSPDSSKTVIEALVASLSEEEAMELLMHNKVKPRHVLQLLQNFSVWPPFVRTSIGYAFYRLGLGAPALRKNGHKPEV